MNRRHSDRDPYDSLGVRVVAWALLAAVIVAGVFVNVALGGSVHPGPYPMTLISVTDGDTFRARVSPWPGWSYETPVRVRGIDTPEIRGSQCDAEKAAAYQAREAARAWLVAASTAATLHDVVPDRWGRVVATVRLGRLSMAQALLDAGHARPYDGGTRVDWCKGD